MINHPTVRICLLQHKKRSQDRGFVMNASPLPTIIVPALLESVRFPRKLLADAGGKPLILRTAERLRKEVPEYEVFFAVDGDELAQLLQKEGYSILLTDPDLSSGTDRIAQANRSLRRKSILNVQADEPMVERGHILALGSALNKEGASMATLAAPFESEEDFSDPNQVKVVLDQEGYAIYFSRAPIPHQRDRNEEGWGGREPFALKHLGMYGYESSFLESFSTWDQGFLERIERLEQLRALEHGCRIGVSIVGKATMGVDLPRDLQELTFADPSNS
jgi:3-deoxy-manno-octulosonate cytidylyltransferase (CMP-KDO synthetase)